MSGTKLLGAISIFFLYHFLIYYTPPTPTTKKTDSNPVKPFIFFFFSVNTFKTQWMLSWPQNYLLFIIFKALALWIDAFYKLKCPCVCLWVRVFTFEVPLKRLFASTSRSRMSKFFLEIQNPWEKLVEKKSEIWIFCSKMV